MDLQGHLKCYNCYIPATAKPMTTKFSRQARLEELTQMELTKQVLVTSSCKYHAAKLKHTISSYRVSLTTKLESMLTYLKNMNMNKNLWSRGLARSCMWHTKTIIPSLPQFLWPPSFVGWWICLSGSYSCYPTHVIKKTIISRLPRCLLLPDFAEMWRGTTQKVAWRCNYVILRNNAPN